MGKKQTLAIGVDDFRRVREDRHYYIDKTLLIRDFIEYNNHVALVTRPRRFGKTLNMTMLRDFFDITQDSQTIFQGLNIMETDDANQINTRPVIYLTFKNCAGPTIESMKESLAHAVKGEYFKYEKLFENLVDKKSSDYYEFYQIYEFLKKLNTLDENGEPKIIPNGVVKRSLVVLIQAVSRFYNQKVLVLIDEYDQPLIEAQSSGFREEFSANIYANLLGDALKGNVYLDQALLTGIQRLVKESIFSKLNNFRVYSVTSRKYASYFGLTTDETQQIFIDYDEELSEDIRNYYDGYLFGGIEIYNPWSIISFLDEGELKPYWINTSTNGLIKEAIPKAGIKFSRNFDKLILRGEVRVAANLETSFVELAIPQTLWGLLVNAGYLTVVRDLNEGGLVVRIPNNEVKREFREIVAIYTDIHDDRLNLLFGALIASDMDDFLELYQTLVYDYVSMHDIRTSNDCDVKHLENSYHMLFLGMVISVSGMYEVTSNLEAGDGRADVIMKSLQSERRPHIVIEFKQGENVEKLKQEALDQIFEKNYFAKLTGDVLCVGIAHNMKQCELVYKEIVN